MNETTRTIPRIRLVARIAAVLCLLGAVALLPVMALALPVTTPTPALPVTATLATCFFSLVTNRTALIKYFCEDGDRRQSFGFGSDRRILEAS